MLNVFLVMFFVCAASFAANTVDLPVEEVSYSHPALEGARVDFLRARENYHLFYTTNQQGVDQCREVRGRQMGVFRVLGSGGSSDDLLERWKALDQQHGTLMLQYSSVLAELRRLRYKYKTALQRFAWQYAKDLHLSSDAIITDMESREPVCDEPQVLLSYSWHEESNWKRS